jgi:hypothetical protein
MEACSMRPGYLSKREDKKKYTQDYNEEPKNIFQEKMRTSKYFATEGSKMKKKIIHRFCSDGINYKFGIVKTESTFTAEGPTVGETLGIIEEIDSEQNFVIFSDSEYVLKELVTHLP